MYIVATSLVLVLAIIVLALKAGAPVYTTSVALYTIAVAGLMLMDFSVPTIALCVPCLFAVTRLVRALRSRSPLIPAGYRSAYSISYLFGFSLSVVGAGAVILTLSVFSYAAYSGNQQALEGGVGFAIVAFLALLTQCAGLSIVEWGVRRWSMKEEVT